MMASSSHNTKRKGKKESIHYISQIRVKVLGQTPWNNNHEYELRNEDLSFLEGELLSCSKGRLVPEEALFIHEDEPDAEPDEAALLLLLSPLLLPVKFIFSRILLVLAR